VTLHIGALVSPSPGRFASVDVARGVALVGMFAYHLTWDFAHFGFVAPYVPFTPEFRLFSHVVASSFLFLAGLSLVLSKRNPFDWRAYAWHIGRIVVAAALVTAASLILFPDGPIFFGILHCIAAALIVATPLLFLPWYAALIAAVLIAVMAATISAPVFNLPLLQWTGLGTFEPSSNDYRAFFPWAAPLLLGVAIMAAAEGSALRKWLARWPGTSMPARVLAFGGRHSLAIYLVHQPIFFALLSGVALALGPPPSPAQRAFAHQCEAQCADSDTPAALCQRACACSIRSMKALNLWDKLLANALDEAEKQILSRVAQECVRHPGP
jgi:uncharacterized membrane protein